MKNAKRTSEYFARFFILRDATALTKKNVQRTILYINSNESERKGETVKMEIPQTRKSTNIDNLCIF
jgi:hypothetical protein